MRIINFLKEYVFSKYLWSNYSYVLLIVVASQLIIIIAFWWSIISTTENFWISVLPSAFVDVISIVISTILVSVFINLYNRNKEKNSLYKIIKVPHKKLIEDLLSPYFSLLRQIPKSSNEVFTVKEIEKFLNKHMKKEVLDKQIISYKSLYKVFAAQDLIDSGKKTERDLLEATDYSTFREQIYLYKKDALEKIDEYIAEYQLVLSKDYISILFSIKDNLNQEPFSIIEYKGNYYGGGIGIQDLTYSKMHKKYADSVMQLIRYFGEIDVQKHWNDYLYDKSIHAETNEIKSIWALCILIFLVVCITILIILGIKYFLT